MKSEKIALVDMDGTLVDFIGQMAKELQQMRSPNESYFDIWADWNSRPDWIEKRMDVIKRQPGWWRNLPNVDLGHHVLDMILKIGYETHILTKGPYRTTTAWTEKVDWCRANLPAEVKVTITEDKGLVYGRVLVDDYPDYVTRWLQWRPRGTVIMPQNPGNKDFRHPRVTLYDGSNRSEVYKKLHEAFERN